MNRRGFTLIELLAVIVVLGLVLTISIPSITDAYKNSKIKSEEAFLERLSQTIDSYVKLNSDKITFKQAGTATKTENETTYSVDIKKGTIKNEDIKIQNIIDDNLISSTDFVNAGNKEVPCNTNAVVEVYKDSDFVYCYKMPIDNLNCLSDNYKEKHKNEDYAIDTCSWETEQW